MNVYCFVQIRWPIQTATTNNLKFTEIRTERNKRIATEINNKITQPIWFIQFAMLNAPCQSSTKFIQLKRKYLLLIGFTKCLTWLGVTNRFMFYLIAGYYSLHSKCAQILETLLLILWNMLNHTNTSHFK